MPDCWRLCWNIRLESSESAVHMVACVQDRADLTEHSRGHFTLNYKWTWRPSVKTKALHCVISVNVYSCFVLWHSEAAGTQWHSGVFYVVQITPRAPLWAINMYLFFKSGFIMYLKCSFINSPSVTALSWSGALPGRAYAGNTWVWGKNTPWMHHASRTQIFTNSFTPGASWRRQSTHWHVFGQWKETHAKSHLA